MSMIDPQVARSVFRKALLARSAELKLLELFSQGKLSGTVHTCVGQEFVGAIVAQFLKNGDAVYSNHRCHGHFLAFCEDVSGLIAEIMGKKSGVCGGVGGSQHLYKEGFHSNGIQGGIVPVSVGLAFAKKLKKEGNIAVVFIGDGTLGEGAVYESLNLASKWEIPLFIICENNEYAQSTSRLETFAGNILDRAKAFGIRAEHGNTWDWQGLYEKVKECNDFIRETRKPIFLQVDTYRLKAHSKGDDNREPQEIKEYDQKDPLNVLIRNGDPLLCEIQLEVDRMVANAVDSSVESAIAEKWPQETTSEEVSWSPRVPPAKKRVVNEINSVFRDLMRDHEGIYFIGEDVTSPYGGAFKVSDELSHLFPGRVLNTPISESAIVGLGTGMSMEGFRPFIEIMFGDFIGLAFDQILNHASKFQAMYGGSVQPNVVIRTPMGGRRGYGPTHSQSLEKHFFGIPGLRVIALNPLLHPERFYRPLLNVEGPSLFIENKILYSSFLLESLPGGFHAEMSNETFPTVWVRPSTESCDVTLIGYGGMTELMLEAAQVLFEEHEVFAQVLCPSQIFPLGVSRFRSVLEQSKAIVVTEEGQGFAGFAAEVMAQIQESALSGVRVGRVCADAHIIPASKVLEDMSLPNVEKLVEKTLELLR